MLWKGNVLGKREDFAEAMVALQDQYDAGQFRAVFANSFPQHTDGLLVHIAADRREDQFDRVMNLLEIDFQGFVRTYMRTSQAMDDLQSLVNSIPK